MSIRHILLTFVIKNMFVIPFCDRQCDAFGNNQPHLEWNVCAGVMFVSKLRKM